MSFSPWNSTPYEPTSCYNCGRLMRRERDRCMVSTQDSEAVYVGVECYRRVVMYGKGGYPSKILVGVRFFTVEHLRPTWVAPLTP